MQPQFITLPRQAKDITGQTFGKLTTLGPIGKSPDNHILWLCQCECGQTTVAYSHSLRCGNTRSCGCLVADFNKRVRTTHGMADTAIYSIWRNIVERCTNPKNRAYHDYGGRGINIHNEWRQDVHVFHDYVSRLPDYDTKGYSIDRIDNNGNYEPGNVRWATRIEQNRNTRTNRLLTYNGKTQCLAAWADEIQLTQRLLRSRLSRGWSDERALSTPHPAL